jgi:hypothetical protein
MPGRPQACIAGLHPLGLYVCVCDTFVCMCVMCVLCVFCVYAGAAHRRASPSSEQTRSISASVSLSARAGTRRFWRLSALRAHTKAP